MDRPDAAFADSASSALPFLAGGGELGARIRAHDWAATSLGAPAGWPQSLKTAVRIMLTSRQPIWLGWGKELIYFYNDAYKSIIGGKHPWALGKPTETVWSEIWGEIGPMLATALRGDEGTYVEQQLLIMERNGYPEETYYTFSYSPVPNDDDSVGGIICANTEETPRVISERQLALLRDLAAGTVGARTWREVCERGAAALASNSRDLPFALIYLAEPGSDEVRLAASCGLGEGHPAAPAAMWPGHAAWPYLDALARAEGVLVHDLAKRFAQALPPGSWAQPPSSAVVLPVTASGETGRSGVLVVGLNPFRLFDDSYAAFLSLVAGQIGAAIATADAYEDERRRAEALAEIDRSKTTFFSNVSHEFRTPLTLMMTPLEEALSQGDAAMSGATRSLVHIAHRNALRLLKLVNTLLDFSRIEAGRIQATYQPTDLAAFTAELASNFRSAVDRAGLTLAVAAPPLPQRVYVDRDMWEKVVLNLISNAFKFTLAGGITVTVSVAADGQSAEVAVGDTGAGIPAEELPHLFERFRRIEGTPGRSIEGSGIGLALVQELVRLHGGSIKVESVVGRGSTFTVSVPFGTSHLAADRIGSDRAAAGPGSRALAYVNEALGWLSGPQHAEEAPFASALDDLGQAAATGDEPGRLVVLADDNADMRDYVQRLLRAARYRVEAFPDGAAALAAVEALKPDLVLSDVMMPKLDGFGLIAAMRANAALRETPILLLSARAGDEAKIEGLDAGADDYLTKPFSARELIARVEVNLRLARLRRESAQILKDEARTLEQLNAVGSAIAAELDLDRSVQLVTDAARELTGAAFGAFFYNVIDARGESYTLYALSGAPREAFARFPMPRNTEVFGPTFNGEGLIRSADITKDPRYGRNLPNKGMPAGHLPVSSYLAAPVLSNSGEVLGGLFFGHPEPDRFDARAERLLAGIATQAGIAIDKARLYRAAQHELERRRETELALRASEQQLERKVAERTAELREANARLEAEAAERERAEEALRQAQKMESIGQLTGGVAHDFNNLLTVILGNLESLARHLRKPGAEAATLERALEHATRGAQRAASLTQRLLAFSRQQPLDPKTIDVNRLVAGMSDLLRRTIGEQVAVETVLAGGLWLSHVDPNQLEVALLNLAVNARDAMPGGGKLTIESANAFLDESYAAVQAEVVPGQYVVISVTDTGLGMSREVMARAFEPFFTTKDVGHGTGLGLSQVYGFVKQSGGHVKLYSEVGHGTTVKIYLPRVLSAAQSVTVEPVSRAPRAATGETILVVEDDDDVRAHTVGILTELGYAVVQAANAEAAFAALRRGTDIQLLFTDVGLPGGVNGRQLADEARRLRPGLKVLFTTGYARNAIVHGGRLDPGVQLITKPFGFSAVAEKLREVLDAPVGPTRLLVVEDEVLVQILAVDDLEDLGFKTDTASSATEALNKLKLAPNGFDGAIVDLGLPDRRGEDLVDEIRAMYPAMPIVVASGHDEARLKSRLTEPRIAFLGKPYRREDLLRALEAVGLSAPGQS